MSLLLSFRVDGEAQPAGSKSSFVPLHPKTKQPYRGPGGRIIVNTVDACKKSGPWKKHVGKIAREAMGGRDPFAGPLRYSGEPRTGWGGSVL